MSPRTATTRPPSRVLIAAPSPLMQEWIAAALSLGADVSPTFTAVDDGIDVLYHLAERGPFDLVVAPVALAHLDGGQVLAMARTAGLYTPFLLTSVLVDNRQRAIVARASRAAIVDPLDAVAVMNAARELMSTERVPRNAGMSQQLYSLAAALAPNG